MKEIDVIAAQTTLGSLLDQVEKGEEIIITRHGRPVARLVGRSDALDRSQSIAAAERIRARARSFNEKPFNWEERKPERDEGRP